ncbi:hypothetical protein [Sinisalibacter aestuarii]|nr:hypothetical protein [Sinisalibacter aestuarii]
MADLRMRLEVIQRDIEKLKAQETLLLEMLQEVPAAKKGGRARKGSVKQTVIDLLTEVGSKGLNANSALDLAKGKGIELERGSVSSLLSRLKHDGVVVYDDDVYRLTEFANQEPSQSQPKPAPAYPVSGVVHRMRTSGDKAF